MSNLVKLSKLKKKKSPYVTFNQLLPNNYAGTKWFGSFSKIDGGGSAKTWNLAGKLATLCACLSSLAWWEQILLW